MKVTLFVKDGFSLITFAILVILCGFHPQHVFILLAAVRQCVTIWY